MQNLHQEAGEGVVLLRERAKEGVVLLGEQAGEEVVLVGGLHHHQMSKNPKHLHQFHM